jgi:hypothetical protein
VQRQRLPPSLSFILTAPKRVEALIEQNYHFTPYISTQKLKRRGNRGPTLRTFFRHARDPPRDRPVPAPQIRLQLGLAPASTYDVDAPRARLDRAEPLAIFGPRYQRRVRECRPRLGHERINARPESKVFKTSFQAGELLADGRDVSLGLARGADDIVEFNFI